MTLTSPTFQTPIDFLHLDRNFQMILLRHTSPPEPFDGLEEAINYLAGESRSLAESTPTSSFLRFEQKTVHRD